VDYASRISEESVRFEVGDFKNTSCWKLETSNSLSEQMLTAARPSRIFTAFPFRYPKTWGLETCSRNLHLAKNTPAYYRVALRVSSEKKSSFEGRSKRVRGGCRIARTLRAGDDIARDGSSGIVPPVGRG
jgi:hypothetical protein